MTLVQRWRASTIKAINAFQTGPVMLLVGEWGIRHRRLIFHACRFIPDIAHTDGVDAFHLAGWHDFKFRISGRNGWDIRIFAIPPSIFHPMYGLINSYKL
ncbi:MAG: hypothetical protein ABI167_09180 [Nitrosospira sp.]